MKKLLLIIIAFFFLTLNNWAATTRFVPCGFGTPCYATIQDAINASAPGDIIQIAAGTLMVATQVNVNIANLTIQGVSNTTTKIQVSGTGYRFYITASGVTIQNLEIEKTDKTGLQNIIYVGANNTTIENNIIHGQFVIGDGETSRGMEIVGGLTGLNIDGNTIYSLRQPAYINNGVQGTISNNYTYITKGWVVVTDCNITFSGNTWGSGTNVNYYDIALIVQSGSVNNYPDIVTMSANNNGAIIENQFYTPAILSVVHVDKNTTSTGNNGSILDPYKTITEAIPRVAIGGKILVAAGIYPEMVTVNKTLTLLGAQAGIDPRGGARTEGSASESIIDGSSSRAEGIYIQGAGETSRVNNVVIDGFEVKYATSANVMFDYANNAILRNTMVHHNTTNEGIKTHASCTSLLIQKCISHDNIGDGIELGDYGTHTGHIIQDCEFYNNADRGIFLCSISNTTVSRVKSHDNQGTVTDWELGGIIVYQCKSTTLTDVECYNNAGIGIYIYKDNLDGTTSTTISGASKAYNNYIGGGPSGNPAPGDGLAIYLSQNVSVMGFESHDNARYGISAGTVGVYGDYGPSNTCQNINLTNCNVYNNSTSAIAILGLGAFNCTATQNSLLSATMSITNTSGNPVAATCNWYGTADIATITGKVGPNVTFLPRLTNGTDNDPGTPGFQPVPGSCSSGIAYYVNDGSTTGDVYTTAVGKDDNSGTPSAPFATINHAISVASSGDLIFVDAGTYLERLIVNKSYDLRGAQYSVDATPSGARTNTATESIIDCTGLPAPNPNIAIDIPLGTTNVTLNGFTIKGTPTWVHADDGAIRCFDDHITIQDNIISGYVGIIYKGNDYFNVLQNRITANKNGVVIQPGSSTNVNISGNNISLGTNPAPDYLQFILQD